MNYKKIPILLLVNTCAIIVLKGRFYESNKHSIFIWYVGTLILLAWYVLIVVQAFLGYGTAYRKAKTNGDNGLSLFGWLIVYCSLASLVPYLGIHLWKKNKNIDKE
ncbi:hypothetical protein RI092_05015 [Lactococcus cremoris]|uniref:hypothetical protein n=1 Tax=Lactococcus lactis subsp. cremoris TaxID=1359 RepID=UPI0028715763|nr:hypothetical protein [Lactococcus cremoris]MDR9867174.1 hypothetical protein [Lactococcus cremoris]